MRQVQGQSAKSVYKVSLQVRVRIRGSEVTRLRHSPVLTRKVHMGDVGPKDGKRPSSCAIYSLAPSPGSQTTKGDALRVPPVLNFQAEERHPQQHPTVTTTRLGAPHSHLPPKLVSCLVRELGLRGSLSQQ